MCRFSHETSRRQERKRRTAEDNVRIPPLFIIIHIIYNHIHVHVCNLIPWPCSAVHDEEIRRLGDEAVCIRCTCTMYVTW